VSAGISFYLVSVGPCLFTQGVLPGGSSYCAGKSFYLDFTACKEIMVNISVASRFDGGLHRDTDLPGSFRTLGGSLPCAGKSLYLDSTAGAYSEVHVSDA
jgi:hypothetical protein